MRELFEANPVANLRRALIIIILIKWRNEMLTTQVNSVYGPHNIQMWSTLDIVLNITITSSAFTLLLPTMCYV